MPPRYAYWTILVDDQPTAFRSGSQEELMPTFNRLKQKHASAKMMWWQNGKLWESRLDAQEAMLARGSIGRSRDPRQPALSERRPTASAGRRESKGDRYSDRAPRASERRAERAPSGKLDWKPKSSSPQAPKPSRSEKPEWKPKGSFKPERQKFAAEGRESRRSAKREGGPEWKPKSFGARPKADWKSKAEWKPKSDWKPRGSAGAAKRPWRPKSEDARPRSEGKLEWTPKGEGAPQSRSYPKSQAPSPRSPEKRKWVPKAEYKKSLGIEAKKDKNWRPGGEHKDPRQKYKDAKKAKWTKFKKNIRARSEGRPRKKNDE